MSIALPASSTSPDYAPAILAAVSAGTYEMPFAKVTSTAGGHTGTFLMSADALKVDGFRPGAGAYLMQQIADTLGCLFPTPKLRDLQWQQRTVDVPPQTIWGYAKPGGGSFGLADMTLVSTMRFISSKIDGFVAAAPNKGIVQNTGKAWVLINDLLTHPGHGANYGWFYHGACPPGQPCSNSPATPGLWMIQGPGTDWLRHDLQQADYAQTINLVHRRCTIDGSTTNPSTGAPWDLTEVLVDPELSALVSHEGPLRVLRQPGVPVVACPSGSAAPPSIVAALASGASAMCGTPPVPSNVTGTSSWLTYVAAAAGITGAALLARYAWRQYKRRARRGY